MGREIRRVPPDWKHPKKNILNDGGFIPLHNQNYDEAAKEWLRGLNEYINEPREIDDPKYFWDYEGMPPDSQDYITYSPDEATWYQVYETVSEGTPVTPPFETEKELIDYLVEHGDFWYQSDMAEGVRDGFRKKPTREAAERFVLDDKFVPSMVMINGEITSGIDISGLQNSRGEMP